MKFCWATINVANLEESLRFYQDIVGLNLIQRFKSGSGAEIVFLGDGETKVELVYHEEAGKASVGEGISLGFEVSSVEEKMTSLKAKGIEIHSGPFQPNPNIKFFYVLDPNGLKIQFVENI